MWKATSLNLTPQMEPSKKLNSQVLRVLYIATLTCLLLVSWHKLPWNNENGTRDGWRLIGTTLFLDIILVPLTIYSFKLNRLKYLSLLFLLFVNVIGLSGGMPQPKYIYLFSLSALFLIFQYFVKVNTN
jgi:CDP-diglyceride synthetase